MCGIAGVIDVAGVERAHLEAMGQALAHRGPDEAGVWLDPGIGFAHRRLSIQDLADGHQPMVSDDERLVVVYNGEIYNFPALRKELEAGGARFRTNCDTEVILHLYRRDGADCVHNLRGMFAFAIWDKDKRRLFAARDHIGQKPFFFLHDRGRFGFASEIKALLTVESAGLQPDIGTMWHHASIRCCPGAETLFAGIRKLPPAHRLQYSPDSGILEIDRYWRLQYEPKAPGSFDEAVNSSYALLDDVVSEHLLSDVPIGTFLSGGVDSSIVTALAQKNADYPVHSFAIGVGDRDFSELPFAAEAAELAGTRHHEFRVDANLMLVLPDIIWHLEEPGDPHAVGLYRLSKLTREYVKVVMGGDGGDEVFGGYTRYSQSGLATTYSRIPAAVRRSILGPLLSLIPESYSYYSLATKARWVHERSFLEGARRHYHAMTFFRFTDADRTSLFTESAKSAIDDPDTCRFVEEAFDSDSAEQAIDRMLFAEQMTRLPEHYLMISDRMSMAHGLESRVPLVDKRILEYSAALPPSYKIAGSELKRLLKCAAARHFSHAFLNREKRGFGFPMARWFRDELQPLVNHAIATSSLIEAGIFDHGYLSRIVSEHVRGRIDHNFRIWMFLNFEVWYRLFFVGQSRGDVRDWIAVALPVPALKS